MIEQPRFLAIGRILRAFGVYGEVKVDVLTDFPERFEQMTSLYVGDERERQNVTVLSSRFHGKHALLRLEGYPDRTAAETLRGLWLYIPLAEAMPLEEDEFYEHEVLGCRVETKQGEVLGRIREVLYTGANEVFVVRGPDGDILIPVTKEVVLEIDGPGQRVLVSLPPGLVPPS